MTQSRILTAAALMALTACGQDPDATVVTPPLDPSAPGPQLSTIPSPASSPVTPAQPTLSTPTSGSSPSLATPISGEEPVATPTLGTPSVGGPEGDDGAEEGPGQAGVGAPPDDPAGETPSAGTVEPAPAVSAPTPDDSEQQPDPMTPTEPAPEDPVEMPDPVVFSQPEGTIPNEPQPASVANVGQNDWRQGMISPSLQEGTQVNQPAVFNGYMLIAGNEEFWFYDVSDPSSPQMLSTFSTPNRRNGGEAESHTVSFARRGDKFYLVTVSGTGIDTWDVSDVRSPEHQGHLGINGVNYGDYTEAVWGVAWQGQYIYVGATNNGVKVVDASDPSSLSLVGEISPSQYGGVSAGPVEAVGNVLVVMTPKESGGVATLDISDPTNPTRLASFSAGTSYIGQFYRRYAFLISPLRAWDVLSDPRNIGSGNSPIGQINHGSAEYLSFSDDKLFLGMARTEIGGTPGTDIFDISDVRGMRELKHVWGRQDRGGKNDDQFNIPFGNLIVMGDDQSPYAGWFIAAFEEDPDTTPPEVDTVIPKDQESVPASSRIGISLSDNIELATVDSKSFIVRPVGGEPLTGTYGSRMTVLNFDPDEELQPGTTYEIVLPAGGIADLVGNRLAGEWKSTFTVK